MTGRVPMVSQERANQLGEEWGMAGPRMTRSAVRTLAVNPELAKPVLTLLSQLLERNQLDARLRELVIMRIGWVTGSAYEWTQHWRVATVTAGIPPEDVLAVRDWRASDRLTAADKAVLAATDETLAGKSISDATWAEIVKAIPDQAQQVEFVVAMGNWTMFSMLLRNLRIPVEDGVAVWPPDGKPSPATEA
jgi:alkylhydroperoxidase family enzyme